MNLYEKIIAHLRNQGKIKVYNGYAMAQCIFPEHHRNGDRTPSLQIYPYNFKCHNPACELHKGGTIFELAEILGILPEGKGKHANESKAVEYIQKRLRFDTKEEAKKFMLRMGIYSGTYGGTDGIFIDLFNGDKKFRNFESGEMRKFRHLRGKDKTEDIPAFGGLIDLLDHKAVIVTEGTFDALTFWRLDLPAIDIEGGKDGKNLGKISKFLKEKGIGVVYFAFDIDKAGQEYLENAIRNFLEEGIDIYIMKIPEEYKDVNEFFMNDPKGFIKAVEEIPENHFFKWYVEKNSFLLDNGSTGEKMLVNKLAVFYQRAQDKKTAWDVLMDVFNEYGINQDDWIETLEKIDIIEANEKRKQVLKETLNKAINELEYKNTEEVIENLKSNLKNYKTIQVRSIKDKADEILNDDLTNSIKSIFFQSINFYPADILLLTAKTKNGKTTLALNMVKDFLKQEKTILYVTYELPVKQLFRLFSCIVTGKTFETITEEDKKRALDEYGQNLYMEEGLTLNEITAYVRTLKPDVFIVDGDNLVRTSGFFETEERRLSYIVSTLKETAIENQNLCILLSQVNEEDKARYSREKEFYASVHLHLEKKDNSLEYTVKLNRFGPSGIKGSFGMNWETRSITSIFENLNGV
jgi:DNA primase